MIFDDGDLLERIAQDPIDGLLSAYDYADSCLSLNHKSSNFDKEDHQILIETYALFTTVYDAHPELEPEVPRPSFQGNRDSECKQIIQYLVVASDELKVHSSQKAVESLRNRYSAALGNQFVYEFSQGDIERIQTLITELREIIVNSSFFEEQHARRLLKRLEKLQQELHKKMSDLDHFWGLVGDAGVAFGKLGENAKPLVDRIREISQIVWRTQARAEELPSDTDPALLKSEEDLE